MNKSDKYKLHPAQLAVRLENFWFRKFRWIYFLVYVPIIVVLGVVIWQNSIRQTEWSAERKQSYVLESGQRGREFQAETFAQIVERIKKSEQIFNDEGIEIRNVFLPQE